MGDQGEELMQWKKKQSVHKDGVAAGHIEVRGSEGSCDAFWF